MGCIESYQVEQPRSESEASMGIFDDYILVLTGSRLPERRGEGKEGNVEVWELPLKGVVEDTSNAERSYGGVVRKSSGKENSIQIDQSLKRVSMHLPPQFIWLLFLRLVFFTIWLFGGIAEMLAYAG